MSRIMIARLACCRLVLSLVAALGPCAAASADEAKLNQPPKGFRALFNGKNLDNWRGQIAEDPRRIAEITKGMTPLQVNEKQKEADKKTFEHWTVEEGVIHYDGERRIGNIETREHFGDCQLHVEWAAPAEVKGESQGRGNSGVFIMGRYEIQVYDSWSDKTGAPKDNPQHSDCGGIYQRWQRGRGFEGHPPRVNAARAPGQWQTFDVLFRAPRFDTDGKKTANARFVRVVHNGKVVHENVELTGPTRAAMFGDEKPTGPMMFQGDHGPVAYRNIVIRPLKAEKGK